MPILIPIKDFSASEVEIDEGPAYSAVLTVEPKPTATLIVETQTAVITIVLKPRVALTEWV